MRVRVFFASSRLSRIRDEIPVCASVLMFGYTDADGVVRVAPYRDVGWLQPRAHWEFELLPYGVILGAFSRPYGQLFRGDILTELQRLARDAPAYLCQFVQYDIRDPTSYAAITEYGNAHGLCDS